MPDRAAQDDPSEPTFILVGGSTETATIDGISAAATTPTGIRQTPAADLEVVWYGTPVQASVVPVSPSGCPTPAIVTRAAVEQLELRPILVDAGLGHPVAAPTVDIGNTPGDDIRHPTAMPDGRRLVETAAAFARRVPADEFVIGETIPGGTTSALAVLTALGERATVSSSLPKNPMELKRRVVAEALMASGLSPGAAKGHPQRALRAVGDPVLAVTAGLIRGAVETQASVTLAGGTQLAAAAALSRHDGVEAPLHLATTEFVAADESSEIRRLASDLDLELTVTDPEFQREAHPALEAYHAGVAKEGVGMGGVLAMAADSNATMRSIRRRTVSLAEDLIDTSAIDPQEVSDPE